jgi:hypothetical protein
MIFEPSAAMKAVPAMSMVIHLSEAPRTLDKANVFRPQMFDRLAPVIDFYIMLTACQCRLLPGYSQYQWSCCNILILSLYILMSKKLFLVKSEVVKIEKFLYTMFNCQY